MEGFFGIKHIFLWNENDCMYLTWLALPLAFLESIWARLFGMLNSITDMVGLSWEWFCKHAVLFSSGGRYLQIFGLRVGEIPATKLDSRLLLSGENSINGAVILRLWDGEIPAVEWGLRAGVEPTTEGAHRLESALPSPCERNPISGRCKLSGQEGRCITQACNRTSYIKC